MKTTFFPSEKRGHIDHDWLNTYHSFSFGHYYNPDQMGFGKLRVINDDTIAPGAGFPDHPHQNMEIITIPLSGSLTHEDSTGGRGSIHPGMVQVMSAGTGVVHSEYNASPDTPLSLFQIWIESNNPTIHARYADRVFDEKEREGKFQLVVSNDGRSNSLMIHQNAFISLGKFSPGQAFDYSLYQKGNGVFLMVITGNVTLGNEILEERDALGIEEAEVIIGRASATTEVLVLEIPME